MRLPAFRLCVSSKTLHKLVYVYVIQYGGDVFEDDLDAIFLNSATSTIQKMVDIQIFRWLRNLEQST
jgi:hypothetical protein